MRFLAPFFAAALALLPASGSAGDDPVFHELGRQQGEIEEAFTAAGGNLREALFALYDRAEARRSGRRS